MKLTHRLLTALLLVPLAALHATDLALSTNGSTGFRIVKPANPSVVDDYALAKLSGYLKQITGVEFPTVSADEAADDSPCLYVGVNAAVNEKLGGGSAGGVTGPRACFSKQGLRYFSLWQRRSWQSECGDGVHGDLPWLALVFGV
jgi:hypothetical protein